MTHTRGHNPKPYYLFLFLIFNSVMAVFALISLPRFVKKSGQASDKKRLWKERLGRIEKNTLSQIRFLQKKGKVLIWVHAVSVGEVQAVKPFVEKLQREMDDCIILISTVTPTGQSVAESLREKNCFLIYFPFDFSFIAKRVIKGLRPDLILLAETEIWPNFILQADSAGVPVGIINGRISKKSANGYCFAGFLLKPVFKALSFLLVQTDADQRRYISLGIEEENIHVLGNMKFDQAEFSNPTPEETELMRVQLGYEQGDQILVVGSTHRGEEKALFQVLKDLQLEFSRLKLIIAPRHPERSGQICHEAVGAGFEPKLFSAMQQSVNQESGRVLILDVVGHLKRLYSLADLVVMGGGFIRHGGQNPIEPAMAEKPVLSGPNVFNFKAVYESFVTNQAAEIVFNVSDLKQRIRALFKDPNLRTKMGHNAKKLVLEQMGASKRHVDWIKHFISENSQIKKLQRWKNPNLELAGSERG